MKAVICPVCTGSGIVDEGFYRRTSDTWTNSGGTEQCRGCEGKGWVCIPSDEDGSEINIRAHFINEEGSICSFISNKDLNLAEGWLKI